MEYEEAVYRESKRIDFDNYFNLTNHICIYNGVDYTIRDSTVVITVARTEEELYSFIIGFLQGNNKSENKIKELEEVIQSLGVQNEENITNYEKRISDISHTE